jgi:hypothetical protein
MQRMRDYTLLKKDGSEYLADVKCPTIVTGAGASVTIPSLYSYRILPTLLPLILQNWSSGIEFQFPLLLFPQ